MQTDISSTQQWLGKKMIKDVLQEEQQQEIMGDNTEHKTTIIEYDAKR